jgi:hypothetical protein
MLYVARTPVDAMITTLSTTRARSKHKQKRKISKRMVARASWDPPESFVSELDGSTCLAQFIGPTGILQPGLEADAAGQTC